jgi:O-antigen biosynthesis protein
MGTKSAPKKAEKDAAVDTAAGTERARATLRSRTHGTDARVQVDGRQFTLAGERFRFAGATYGTFVPRSDGELYPPAEKVRRDFSAMSDAGLTIVRVYTAPPPDVLDAAEDAGLRIMAGLHHPDWRDFFDSGTLHRARIERSAVRSIRDQARRLAGDPRVAAICIGNEIPADVIRWVGVDRVRKHLRLLALAVRAADPDVLITYANYPTAEYLEPDLLDFVTFNVYLERPRDLKRYLPRLLNQAGDRPVVVGELGRHVGDDEAEHALWLGEELRAVEEGGGAGTCVFSWTDEWAVAGKPIEGWQFGMTRADRTPRPALEELSRHAKSSLRDCRAEWPKVSVVVCAYNEEATIAECLKHTTSLDYPNLEVVVVDDGSTDKTREIAESFPVDVIGGGHAGLSAARNTGWLHATGDIIAFLDADAYPSPEWPYHLALSFEDSGVGAAGGPNVGPVDDPFVARCVSASPGGPNHVLITDRRAEHVPGCNLALRRSVLEEIGGFDPQFRTAGDDVDVCWRVLEHDYDIAFAPSALVWHHRRATVRTYLRQQVGYGRAEAIIEKHHPDRCGSGGTVRWHGRIYTTVPQMFRTGRVYRGLMGTAPFQSVYAGDAGWGDVAHQLGVPAAMTVATIGAALAVAWRQDALALTAAAAMCIVALALVDAVAAGRKRTLPRGWAAPALIAALSIAQPIARLWGRKWHGRKSVLPPSADGRPLQQLSASLRRCAFALDRTRAEVTAALIASLRQARLRVLPVTGWEDHDGEIETAATISSFLVTSEHPAGVVQARLRVRPRWARLFGALVVVAAAAAVSGVNAALFAACVLTADLIRAAVKIRIARYALRRGYN